jgi:hypothetical protein
MGVTQTDLKLIINFVKKEPRTIQEISKLIKRSWVTTDSYVKQVRDETGLIDIKIFRKGTQGALKIVYPSYAESATSDEVKEQLYHLIRNGRVKKDFDFMEVYQYVPNKKKRVFVEEYTDEEISKKQQIVSLFRQADNQVYVFSGNLSFINMKEGKTKIIDVIEDLLKRKIRFKILTRVNIASISNINKLNRLMTKYPDLVEIRHTYQPLRGFIIDDKIVRFKNEETVKIYKKGELHKNTRIFYEVTDKEWVAWLQKVFWHLFRSALDHEARLKEVKRIF